MNESKFKIGEIVAIPAFKDCFGKLHARIEMTRVTSVAFVENGTMPFYRVRASESPNGSDYFEASERFFEKLGN